MKTYLRQTRLMETIPLQLHKSWVRMKIDVKIVSYIFLLSLVGCKSTGKLVTTPPSAIVELSSSYEVKRSLGNTPTPVNQEDSIARYMIESEDGTREYVMILDPDSIKGDIPIPLTSKVRSAALVQTYNDYFDQVLRVQRLIRRGQFTEAKRLLAKVNDEYDLTYGALVLAGTIATLENKPDEAREHFRMAKSLFPEDSVLNGVVPQ